MSPSYNDLYGFIGGPINIVRWVKLHFTLKSELLLDTQVAEFMVVNEDMSYNETIGRPFLKEMRVVTSIYHISMKFSNPNKIWCIQGCHTDSNECYTKVALSLASLGSPTVSRWRYN